MPSIDLLPNSNTVVLECSPREVEMAASIPGLRFKPKLSRWEGDVAWSVCLAARGVFGTRLTIGPALEAWAWRKYEENQRLLAARMGAEPLDHPRLYDYQRTDAGWMSALSWALNTNEMGTGKTPTTIAALNAKHDAAYGGSDGDHPIPDPILVISSNSMKYGWEAEFGEWWPSVRCAVLGGSAAKRRKMFDEDWDVLIVNWELLRKHTRLAPYPSVTLTDEERTDKELNAVSWWAVVADEVHRAIDPRAKQTRAWWQLAHGATVRYGLTATPISQNCGDFWSVLHGLAPQEFPVKSKFIDRYTVSGLNLWGGLDIFGLNPATEAELFQVIDPHMCRRTLSECRPSIPEFVPIIREVEMDPKQAKAYELMKKEMVAAVDGGVIATANPLTKHLRLRQFAAATATVTEDGDVLLSTPSCKVDGLLDVLDEAPGEAAVVFAESKQLIDLCDAALKKRKITYMRITGDEDAEARQEGIRAFQAGEVQVALCTYAAGSESITLTRANRVIRLQLSESLIKNKQAPGRVRRATQQASELFLIDIVTRGTVDTDVEEAGAAKAGYLEEIVRDKERVCDARLCD